MALAQKLIMSLLCFFRLRASLEGSFLPGLPCKIVHHTPSTIQELVHASQAVFIPLQLLVRRSHEQDISTHCIGAVSSDHVFGANNVALRLRHYLAVFIENHALAQ